MKNRNKRKGSARENNLVNALTRKGYLAIRCALSAGGVPKWKFAEWFPEILKRRKGKPVRPIDIIAMHRQYTGGMLLLIQVSRHENDISVDERTVLIRIAEECGAIPILAWIESQRWKFVNARLLFPVKLL